MAVSGFARSGFLGVAGASDLSPATTGVTITVAELQAVIGAKDVNVAGRVLAAATAIVLAYAPGAPSAILNEAVIRASAWLLRSPATEVSTLIAGPAEVSYRPLASRHVLRASGAIGVLSQWRRPQATVLGD